MLDIFFASFLVGAKGQPRERTQMYYVQMPCGEAHSDQTYIGSTHDPRARLAQHNSGKSIHTNQFKPWNLLEYAALPEKQLAETFEKYLKT